MVIEKKAFVKYDLNDKDKPISIKLNDKDKEMIAIGMYSLNMHSKSGVLKELAHMGLRKVILDGLGMEKWHYLTRGDRTRLIQDKPKMSHFREKVD